MTVSASLRAAELLGSLCMCMSTWARNHAQRTSVLSMLPPLQVRRDVTVPCDAALASRSPATRVLTPKDVASLATLLAKHPGQAAHILENNAPIRSGGNGVRELLDWIAEVARKHFGVFTVEETTELLHALAYASIHSLPSCLNENSELIQKKVGDLDPRALAMVANVYARSRLRDSAVMLAIARRGKDVMCDADGPATASLAHAFAKL